MSVQSTLTRIRRILDREPARLAGLTPLADGNRITLGDRRIRVLRADGDTLEWEGDERDDDGWWPATGPHTEETAYAEDREDAAEGVATWLIGD